jgi:hypothetical protein
VEDEVAFALLALLTSSIGGKTEERGAGWVVLDVDVGRVATLGIAGTRVTGTDSLLMRGVDGVLAGEGVWRATAGTAGTGGFGTGFAIGGAFGGTAGGGTVTGSVRGGVTLTFFSTDSMGGGAALMAFPRVDFLAARTGADCSPTAGMLDLREVPPTVGVVGSGDDATGSISLGGTVSLGTPIADSVPDSATGSATGAVEDAFSAVGAALVSSVDSFMASADGSAIDSCLFSAGSSVVMSAIAFSTRGGSARVAGSGIDGLATTLGVELADAADSAAGSAVGVDETVGLAGGDGTSAALSGSV